MVKSAAANTPQRSGTTLAAETWIKPATNSGMAPPSRLPSAPTPSSKKLLKARTPTRCCSVVFSIKRGIFVTQYAVATTPCRKLNSKRRGAVVTSPMHARKSGVRTADTSSTGLRPIRSASKPVGTAPTSAPIALAALRTPMKSGR